MQRAIRLSPSLHIVNSSGGQNLEVVLISVSTHYRGSRLSRKVYMSCPQLQTIPLNLHVERSAGEPAAGGEPKICEHA